MKTGIVIPFFNGHGYIRKLIESFNRAAEGLDCTMYIIDNSSKEISIDVPQNINLPVEIIREKPGIGYGKACNRGYQICKEKGFDYIIISNQDGYVSDSIIRDLITPFNLDERIMISAPLLRIYDGNQMETFFVKYYASQVPDLLSDLMDGHPKPYYELDQISGACFAFNLKNNRYCYPYFFDPLFHMYAEDEDLCLRVLEVKGKIVLVSPNAVFYHKHSYTTDDENKKGIHAESLVSEKILRLKDGKKNSVRVLYGIAVTTASTFVLHFFRGDFWKSFSEVRSFFIVLFRLPAILKSRSLDHKYIVRSLK